MWYVPVVSKMNCFFFSWYKTENSVLTLLCYINCSVKRRCTRNSLKYDLFLYSLLKCKHRIFSPNEVTGTRMFRQYTLTRERFASTSWQENVLLAHPDKGICCRHILTKELFAGTSWQENVLPAHPEKRTFCRHILTRQYFDRTS